MVNASLSQAFKHHPPFLASNDGGVSSAPGPAIFPNSTITTVQEGSFVAAEQYLNYNIQAKEHQAGMNNLPTCVRRINLS